MANPTTTQRGAGKTATDALAAKTTPSLKLDDLSPGDRARLLEEAARSITDAATVAVDADAAARDALLRAAMDDRDHMKGCPADGRIEAYADTIPADGRRMIPAQPVTIVRCIECGGASVLPTPYATFVAHVATKAAAHTDIEENDDDG